MTSITVIGTGTQARAVAGLAEQAGAVVQTIGEDAVEQIAGEIVVLAVPYPARESVVSTYKAQLAGKIVLDVAEPRDPKTHELLLSNGSSGAELLAEALPESTVIKAFSTTPAEELVAAAVSERIQTVLVVGDDRLAKQRVMRMAEVVGVEVVDDGPLERARELEREGFLERTLEVAVDVDRDLGGGLIP